MTKPDRSLFREGPKIRDLSQVIPVENTHQILRQGNINQITLVKDESGNLYVLRSLRPWYVENSDFKSIGNEYTDVGFLHPSQDSVLARRSPREQAAFMRKAAFLGLPVVPPAYVDNTTLLIPYIPGETLEDHLKGGKISAIEPVLEDLTKAHSMNIIYGDRWTANTIVLEDGIISPIDFDISLKGSHAAEFEMAQAIVGISGQVTDIASVREIFRTFYLNHTTQYDWRRVVEFIQMYEIYLTEIHKADRPPLEQNLGLVISSFQ